MNYIELSSNNTEYHKIMDTLYLRDHTELTVNFERINEDFFPLFLKIDWGDGILEHFDNDVFATNPTPIKRSKIINTEKEHVYYPSKTSLYKQLSAQFLIKYSNGDITWIIQPIILRTYDFFESIEDLDVIGVNIHPNGSNNKTIHFKTKKDSYIIKVTR